MGITIDTFNALSRAIFSRGNASAYVDHVLGLYVLNVSYDFDLRELHRAALDGNNSLVDHFMQRIGGSPVGSQFRRHVEHVVAQRERRFSLRAARRHGRHKVLAPSPGVVAP